MRTSSPSLRRLAQVATFLALAVVLVAGGAIGVNAMARHGSHGTGASGSGITVSATPGGTVSVRQFAQVVIDAPAGTFQFDPATLTIHMGTTVVWRNTTIAEHTATSDVGDPAPFDSGIINPSSTFSFTFTVLGTYNYHCNIHAFMHGTIIVTS